MEDVLQQRTLHNRFNYLKIWRDFTIQTMNLIRYANRWAENVLSTIFYSRVFAAALKEMGLEGKIMEAPNDCNTTATTWETGKKLFE